MSLPGNVANLRGKRRRKESLSRVSVARGEISLIFTRCVQNKYSSDVHTSRLQAKLISSRPPGRAPSARHFQFLFSRGSFRFNFYSPRPSTRRVSPPYVRAKTSNRKMRIPRRGIAGLIADPLAYR